MFNYRCVRLSSKEESEKMKIIYYKIPAPPSLIPADLCAPKLRNNSAHPPYSIKTCHYQAQFIEKFAVSL